MSRTAGYWEQMSPFTDGMIPFPLSLVEVYSISGTAPTLTRETAGDYNLSMPASSEAIFVLEFGPAMFRTGLIPFLQEQFGTAAGVAGPTTVATTGDPLSQPVNPGYPPFTGATQITPTNGFIPKGVKLNNFTIDYEVDTATLTTFNATINKTVYVDNTAPAVTSLLGSTGLTKTFRANPYLATVTPTTPAFNVTDNSIISMELDVVTPATSVFVLNKIFAHVSFNFN